MYEKIIKWAKDNEGIFEDLYRKDNRRHYNKLPFQMQELVQFILSCGV